MVSNSNYWLIAADWRQYFFIKYRNLPPETIGVPPLARAIVPSGTARKAAGDLRRLRPVGQTSAGLLVILDFRRPLSRGRPLCLMHGGRGERRMKASSLPPDFPRYPWRVASGSLRITSTRSPVCPSDCSLWNSPAAFRPGIHSPKTIIL